MRYIVVVLLLWPHGQHVERFTATITTARHVEVVFKKPFPKAPACTSNAAGMEWYPDRIVLHGTPGTVVTGECK